MNTQRIRTRSLLLLVLLLATAAATAQQRPRTPTDEYRPILYVVEGGAAPLYLYGSLHVAPADVLPPPLAARGAFSRSDRLITEVVLSAETEMEAANAMLARAFLEEGTTLSDLLSREQYYRVRRTALQVGLPLDGIELMQPWAVELAFTESGAIPDGFSVEYGLDRYFARKATARQMDAMGLETVDEQMQALAGGSLEEQVASLMATLSSSAQTQFLDLYEAWRSGNTEALTRMVEESMMRDLGSYYDRLLTRRNQVWTERLDVLLTEPVPTFVVVGAAHLVGDNSLQSKLTERGYQIRRLFTADDL